MQMMTVSSEVVSVHLASQLNNKLLKENNSIETPNYRNNMDAQNAILAAKILYVLTWTFVASYYFGWGANEPSVPVASVDESGWSPDGTYAKEVIQEVTA